MNKGVNRYGLDIGYFRNLINREFSDLSNFRPDEFARVCARMAKVADSEVLSESEFLAPQWVSVSDRLPNDNQQVLSCGKDGRIFHTMFMASKHSGKYLFGCMLSAHDHDNVTHWQPLPTAPEVE